jgi:hypothetical protein
MFEICDEGGCPALAGVTVATPAGTLHFCLHHARGHFTLEFDEVVEGAVVLLIGNRVQFREKVTA